MASDEQLVSRVRASLGRRGDLREIRMFGGVCFTVAGHMCCGVTGSDLVLRLGVDAAAEAMRQPGVRPMDFTGRPLAGMVYVTASASSGRQLDRWISRALAFVGSLPPKPARRKTNRSGKQKR